MRYEAPETLESAVALLAALSALTIGAGSVSLALFTDQDSSTWSFTAGTIDRSSVLRV